jgi:hypothetical protein
MTIARTRQGAVRRLAAAAAMLAFASAAAAPAPQQTLAAPAAPEVRETTIIHADGDAGTRVTIPEGVWLKSRDQDLAVTDADYAFSGVAYTGCGAPDRVMCIRASVHHFPELTYVGGDFKSSPDDAPLDAGEYDIYIVSEGVSTLTLTFTGAPKGRLELDATGAIDAHAEWLTPHCVDDPAKSSDCLDGVYGGATFEVRAPAYAEAVSIVGKREAGSQAGIPCLDPWVGTSPNGARDSQYGCPVTPTDPGWQPTETVNVAIGSFPTPTAGSVVRAMTNNYPDGEVYAGFYARQQTLSGEPGITVGLGLWINGGITYDG